MLLNARVGLVQCQRSIREFEPVAGVLDGGRKVHRCPRVDVAIGVRNRRLNFAAGSRHGALGEFLAGEVEAFPDHETLFLLEPSLVTNPPAEGDESTATDAIATVADATDADVVVQTFYGALDEKLYAHLVDEAGADALGLDLVAGDRDDTVYNVQEFGATDSLALGLVDGQNTLVEEPETVAERVEWFESQVPAEGFDTTYLTPNTELFYLPANKYRAKLNALSAAAEVLD